MDKKTIIGFLLIAVIIIGFSLLNKPSKEEVAQQRRYNDSIALVQQARIQAEVAAREASAALTAANNSSAEIDEAERTKKLNDAFGAFGVSAVKNTGSEQFYTLENELLRVKLDTKGGRIYSAELKNYMAQDSMPLFLFDGEESLMNFTLITSNNRIVNTKDLYFEPVSGIKTGADGEQTFTLRLNTNENAHLDFVYTLPADDYMLSFNIVPYNINSVLPLGTNSLEMQWASKIRQQEKGRKFEERYAAINYKFAADNDVEKMSESKNDSQRLTNRVKWIAFKDQFFSSILIADDAITTTNLTSRIEGERSGYLKTYTADMVIPFDPTGKEPTSFRMYLGPNHYKTLSSYDKGEDANDKLYLRKVVPLGWGIFGWVNRFFIIPMFNFFSSFIGNMGLIILLMTIVVKIVIFPMTYKSYMSSAKMRVLKPEIDEINARIPAEKAAERQKATMDLYSKVGVSPMSGCLPMLLQMPILIAMFSFFPAAIELRQESFLWAKDLSTYDAIISWNFNIPIISNLLGNHISLFCVLMTITTFVSNKLNAATQTAAAGDQMQMMKWMMNLMPLMFFFMFNNYASGLTYYYFLSTLISVVQTYVIRATVNEEKLLAELHAKGKAKKNNPKKKSSFMERLEKMQREQQKAIQQQNKRK
ncbi:membrane protein insertase YidC [Paludibacter sp. 221]|uniref:membrane protein insertase YidC n=1 Tax=Paludibacter sp. 221 TaxID=2302939 RepID=UPI0013D25470|nr:membrane protein insertase YidC [Paludibacter sp. 221]NDV47326.1 membrane protein insertase YidC [Paludibacter sp. 221]